MRIEILDKVKCFEDIVSGELDLDKTEVYTLGFMDEPYIEPLGLVGIETIRFLVKEDGIFFVKVIDN